MNNPWRLDGQLALITGASKGLGAAMAHEFAALGCNLILNARGSEGLESLAANISERFTETRIQTVASDLSTEDGRDRLVETVADHGALQILINNVGTNIRKPMSEISQQEFLQIQSTNVTSHFEMSRRLLPYLKAGAPASVVNNASVAGLTHLRTGAPYGMSKAALVQMTRNCAVEWASLGIRVNAVAPWY
ncbi:MAG: SDR family NAD(P)-dependent oxidoreductase, partial [Xanthomonadales bacterium]|nr:SDR family NAD(P)-dependent oxidoreductase [Xanthomonadales bacterium]